MHVVIIGNGIAGINAASALAAAEGVSVEVFAGESHAFYSRVRLGEVLSGAQPPEAITFYKPEWYEKKRITVHTGKQALSIDRAGKTVMLSDGEKVSYDYLVLATGASANKPSIPGVDLSGAFTMRTLDDVAAIRKNISCYPETASVIGGGLLGLEAAKALKDAGVKEVRVFERTPWLLARQLDETGGSLLRKRYTKLGIDVVCGAEVREFLADGPRAATVALKDGRSYKSDTTILSMGVCPNTGLAKASGLTVSRGIVVDNHLRTDDPHIYAVGDCAEYCGVVWGIVPAALEQAPVAAKSILSAAGLIPEAAAPLYCQTVPKTALKIGDIEVMSFGKAVLTDDEASSGTYTVMSREDGAIDRYEKYVLTPAGVTAQGESRGGEPGGYILAGAILYGSKAHQGRVQKLSGNPVTLDEIKALLEDFQQ
jgi:NAD(P)H-nitrite reductase large subunit